MQQLKTQLSRGLDERIGEWKELGTLGKVSRRRESVFRTSVNHVQTLSVTRSGWGLGVMWLIADSSWFR